MPVGADQRRPAQPDGRIGVALLGCGAAARQYHLRALRSDPRSRLVAIADPSPQALLGLPGLPGVELFADPIAAIAHRSVEAVVIAASTPAHEPLGRLALEHGRHVYLEKPVALDRGGAHALAARASASGRTCVAGFNYRFNPAFAELRERLRGGEIGAVRSVDTSFCEPVAAARLTGWRGQRVSGGGTLLDLASHELDTLRWLLGQEIASVERAEVRSLASTGDEASFELLTRDGVPITSRVSYRRGREHRWRVEGERGTLRLDRWPARVSSRRRGVVSAMERRLRDAPIPRREPSFTTALGAFLRAAMGEGQELATFSDGAHSLDLVLGIERAAQRGERIELQTGRDRSVPRTG